jgi:phage replication O-like protein O
VIYLTKEKNLFSNFDESGYTRVPNRLLEALVTSSLNRVQMSICLYLQRFTYGWNQEVAAVTFTKIADACGCSVTYASRQMQSLIQLNVIRRVSFQPGKIPIYAVNPNISEWDKSCLDYDALQKNIEEGIFTNSRYKVRGLPPGSDAELNQELKGVPHLEAKEGLLPGVGVNPLSALEPPEFEDGLKKGLKKKKKRRIYSDDSIEFQLSQLLLNKILQHIPGYKLPDLQKWSEEMALLIRSDQRQVDEIRNVILYAQQDPFWQNNILSVSKLRKQYDMLNGKRLSAQNSSAANSKRSRNNARTNSEEADDYKDFYR